MLSPERQIEIITLNESKELSETMKEEKERTISHLKEYITELETSNEGPESQLQQQRDEIAKITEWLKTDIDSSKRDQMKLR